MPNYLLFFQCYFRYFIQLDWLRTWSQVNLWYHKFVITLIKLELHLWHLLRCHECPTIEVEFSLADHILDQNVRVVYSIIIVLKFHGTSLERTLHVIFWMGARYNHAFLQELRCLNIWISENFFSIGSLLDPEIILLQILLGFKVGIFRTIID